MKKKSLKDNDKGKASVPFVNAYGFKVMGMAKTRGQSSSSNNTIKKKKAKASHIYKGKNKLHADPIPLAMEDLVGLTFPYILPFSPLQNRVWMLVRQLLSKV